ncbi:MAG: amidohydrolase [Chloroflexi bacterium]|nr:amidohydrolase [Chloroflexota bacterium]
MIRGALLACLLLAACASPAPVPARAEPTAAGTPPVIPSPLITPAPLPPAGVTPRPAGAFDQLFDAHIHYSQDAWSEYTPAQTIAILRRAGIRTALVSSTPDTGTQRLYALAPDLVVPMLRPYRTRDDIGGWTRDGTVVAYVESTYRRGVHQGIGEFHLLQGEASLPVVRRIVDLAVRESIWLHAHADERAIAELARSEPRAKILWAHAGLSSSAAAVKAVLDQHLNVAAELALRSDVANGPAIDPAWREVFTRHPGRVLLGTDTWIPSRWEDVVAGHERTRQWLRALPPEVAAQIASGNGERLFRTPH